jgi:hypothetical protein
MMDSLLRSQKATEHAEYSQLPEPRSRFRHGHDGEEVVAVLVMSELDLES